ncbi:MAG: homoserine dehydrogenase [Anaerotardibacter sp.]
MAIKIGLVGTGTVGAGCLDILAAHKEDFKRHYGVDIEVAGVCSLEPEVANEYGYADVFTPDFNDIITNPEIDIVIELIGGTTFAKTVIEGAVANGKHVVTANKALVATKEGADLINEASAKGLEFLFEASVGGGIPIINPLKHCLTANEISSILGIVNGTTNYMLTRMDEEGLSYDEALAQAQALGFAEANPTADVDGFDAAAKIAILASIAFNSNVTIEQVYTEGIRRISPVDMQQAREMGYEVKLVAHASNTEDGVSVRVHPTMIPASHQLSTVRGVFNAIYVVGDAVGEAMFFGEGAGSGPAASSVMGDVLEIARHITFGIKPLKNTADKDELKLVAMEDLKTKYYLRFVVEDRSGVLAEVTSVFAKYGISIKSIVQHGKTDRSEVDLVVVTHTALEANMRKAIEEILALDNVVTGGYPSVIRVEE